MNKTSHLLWGFLSLWLFSLGAHSAERLTFRNIDLPGRDVVVCLAQDDEGMMWLGTLEGGLYRYDGYHCYPCLADDSLRCTVHNMVAEGDSLYLCTDRGLLIYNRRTTLCHYPRQQGTADARTIVRQGERFLLGTHDGIYAYTPKEGRVSPVCREVNHVYSMATWGEEILVAAINGFYRVSGSSAQEVSVGNRTREYVSIVVADRQTKGRYWIGAYGQLFSYEPASGRFLEEGRLNNSSVKSIGQSPDGRLYVGTDNGLYVVEPAGVTRYLHDALDSHSIGNNIIWSSFVDRSGQLWLGTDTGVSLAGGHPDFHYIPVGELTGSSSGNYLTTLFEDREQTLWIGGSSGLIRYPLSRESLWYQMGNPTAPITHNRIRSIRQDSDGDIWICSDYGINLWHPDSHQLTNLTLADSTGRISARWIYDVVEDASGRLWIASYDGGVMVASKQQLKSSSLPTVTAQHNLLPEEHVSSLLADRQGDIWIRASGGVYVAHPATMELRRVSSLQGVAMTMDSTGKVWVAGRGRLYGYAHSGATPDVVTLSTDDDEIVALTAIGPDLWIWTEREGRVMHPEGTVHLFHIPGFRITSAYYAPHSGKVYLGGSDALLMIDTAHVLEAGCSPLQLSQLLIGHRPSRQAAAAESRQPIRLPYSENSFTLRFTDLPYLQRQPSVYAYRMEGADERWHRIDPATLSIPFNALPPGHYRLQVCAIDGRGNPLKPVWQRDIILLPPWYLTPWMKLFYLLCGLAIVWLTIRVYGIQRRLREEQQAKQRIVSESQRRIGFYRTLYDDILTSLHGILSPLGQQLATPMSADTAQAFRQMWQEARTVNALVWDACASISDEVHPIRPATPIDLVPICRQIVESACQRGPAVQPPVLFSSEVVRAILCADYPGADMALSRLLRFLLRHRPDGSQVVFHLSTSDLPRQLLVSLHAPGLHITEEMRPYLLQRYALPGQPHPDEAATTLFQARLWVEQQGGSVYLIPGQEGDTFRLTLPLTEDPLPQPPTTRAEEHQASALSSPALPPVQPTESDERLLREVIQVIGDHIDDRELNVCRLQQLLGIGDKMLYRKIKMMTGMTPVEYIRDIRMKRAAVLLRGGQFSVAEVMYMVGFSNSGYFSKCFQRTFGVTPTNYR